MTDASVVPPQNLEAEESVLGACLISRSAIDNVSEILDAADFYRDSHATIYKTILALAAKGEPADALTVSAALPQQKTVIYQLASVVPASANAAHYARIVRESATLRGLIRGGAEISRLGWDGGDARTLVEQAEAIIYKLSQQRTHTDAVDMPSAVRSAYDELVELDGKPRELLGVSSGLADLDRLLRGFRKGGLVVVAADTGRGKSALWLNMILHLCGQGRPAAAFSLEMSEAELIQRALALEASIPHDRVTRGEIRGDEWGRLAQACEALVAYPLALWTDALIRPAGVRSTLRKWLSRQPEGAIAVVDYLQLLVPDEKTDNRVQDVSAISRSLKVTAMDLQIPIIAVSQLRRRLPNTRPHRNDLRESGSIENDADVVLLIHHDENESGIAELIVAKNRHGAEGSVKVKWTGNQMRFGNLVHEAVAA